ncbi:tetratricopeptide repeat protein [Actinomadura rubrisoli]|uniref:Tetratricopeptide repeat protein n=2 Tax=Actinomadura rubrisoli TaxID=2530368 RepID=A0A4R5BH60_9ACTN|nr:tetratricopeptide repeat protein [Actinomadura rubrisoli]
MDSSRQLAVAWRLTKWSMWGAPAVGAGLWWATGHWQWIFSLVAVPSGVTVGYAMIEEGIGVPAAYRSEKVVKIIGYMVIVAGLISWAWTARWWLAVVGCGLGFGTSRAMSIRQNGRNKKRVEIANALLGKGVGMGRASRSEEAIDFYQQVLSRFGDDPRGDLRECVAEALINTGAELCRLDRSAEAFDIYGHVISRFHIDIKPKIRKTVAKAVKERNRIGPPCEICGGAAGQSHGQETSQVVYRDAGSQVTVDAICWRCLRRHHILKGEVDVRGLRERISKWLNQAPSAEYLHAPNSRPSSSIPHPFEIISRDRFIECFAEAIADRWRYSPEIRKPPFESHQTGKDLLVGHKDALIREVGKPYIRGHCRGSVYVTADGDVLIWWKFEYSEPYASM